MQDFSKVQVKGVNKKDVLGQKNLLSFSLKLLSEKLDKHRLILFFFTFCDRSIIFIYIIDHDFEGCILKEKVIHNRSVFIIYLSFFHKNNIYIFGKV